MRNCVQNWRDKHPQKIIFIRMFKKKIQKYGWLNVDRDGKLLSRHTKKYIHINENKKL